MEGILGSEERPLCVAVVGSGPSGFYAAEALLSSEKEVRVDMFDRLPAPFGLVRYGVAPDHAKIKNVIKVYERTAAKDGFSFYGNVNVGKDISVEELRRHYDALIFATGAETDRHLNIPGIDLEGSYTATAFVGWYNGHPDYRDYNFDLNQETAMVIGVGNVAMDVARILAKTVDELKTTDIAAHALERLAKSKVKHIHVVGRRGPVQAAFTPTEIREFGELEDCDCIVDPKDLDIGPVCQQELNDPQNSQRKKNFEILKELSQRTGFNKSKKIYLHFLKSPTGLKGGPAVQSVVLEKNQLSGEANRQKSRGTGVTEEIPCGLFFRSVGYRGVAIEGVPFNEDWGVIANEGGRVTRDGQPMPGLYTVGWIKRGPSGVVGTNKPCSIETVQHIFEDLPGLEKDAAQQLSSIDAFLEEKGIRSVSFEDWKAIDAEEVRKGTAEGKPREKLTRVDEMLDVIGK